MLFTRSNVIYYQLYKAAVIEAFRKNKITAFRKIKAFRKFNSRLLNLSSQIWLKEKKIGSKKIS